MNKYSNSNRCWKCVPIGICLYALTSVPVWLGVYYSHLYPREQSEPVSLLMAGTRWDGQHYREIVTNGYSYDPRRPSNIAFFPVFPAIAWLTCITTSLNANLSLLLVSNASLCVSFALFYAYVTCRDNSYARNDEPEADGLVSPSAGPNKLTVALLATCCLGLIPTSFFFRMAYSESVFLVASLATLMAIARRKRLWLVALCAGIASATRPVGIALVVPVALYAWDISQNWRSLCRNLLYALPIALSGLLAFGVFQYVEFSDPIAFAHTQDNWRIGNPASKTNKILTLLSLEPLWRVYDPTYPGYWRRLGSAHIPINLQFANPIYFCAAVVLSLVGVVNRKLNRYESAYVFVVLLLPFVTRSAEMCCASMARFSAVAFPVYIVVGEWLVRLPKPVLWSIGIISAILLCTYSAAFGRGEPFF